MASYQDEGYSEDPLTTMQLSNDETGGRIVDVPLWVSNMPVTERARMYKLSLQLNKVTFLYFDV